MFPDRRRIAMQPRGERGRVQAARGSNAGRGGSGGNRGGRGRNAATGDGNSNGRQENDRKGTPKRAYQLSYTKLNEYSCMEPDDVIVEIVRNREAFAALLRRSDLKIDWVKAVTKIFSKILQSSMDQNAFHIVSLLPGSVFVKDTLCRSIQELPVLAQMYPTARNDEFLLQIVDIFHRFCQSFPSSVQDLPLDNLILVAEKIQLERKEEFLASVGAIINRRDEIVTERLEGLRLNKRIAFNSQGPPPEDFRELSVLPTLKDIHLEGQPYLRPIKSKGKYSDGEEYLDVQFRLLKEDFVAPLREGIAEISRHVTKSDRKQNICVYRDVKIMNPVLTAGGVTHRISFDVQTLERVNWQHSRRLIYGALVCFTKDNFQTCIFATVANRTANDLAKGEVCVRFLNGLADVVNTQMSDTFTLAESPSYFEAYKHVLKGLQSIKKDKIPFAHHIIFAEKIAKYPKYIREDISQWQYDLTGCLTDEDTPCRTTLLNIGSAEKKSILNRSQLEAVEKGLSREFTIIQGPPGTGKTFVGLRLIHALLKNINIWKGNGQAHVLVVCFTNHALDQFIEGLVKLGHKDIIRVGGRCQNELVQMFSLRNKKGPRGERGNKDDIERAIGKLTKRKYELSTEISEIAGSLESLANAQKLGRIVDLDALVRYLPTFLKDWFIKMNNTYRIGVPFLEMFLGLYPFHEGMARQQFRRVVREHGQGRFVDGVRGLTVQEADDDEVIDIEGEAEAMTDRWVMEMEFTPLHNNKMPMNEEPDEDVQGVLIDEDGFELVVPSKRERKALVRHLMSVTGVMTKEQVYSIGNPMDLTKNDRWGLYKYLLERYTEVCKELLVPLATEYDDRCSDICELQARKDENHIRASTVIAMTTTGAAKHFQVLQRIQPKIIMIEEAAEVLEAHVLTALHEKAEHVILIGDHKQLKPKPTVYKLAKEYQLELSLFERMIKNGMDCHRLDVQHRMRPEISRLLQDIYPGLQDHPTVEGYPEVKGVSSSLYFIDHQSLETTNRELKSKANQHEAEYVVALCWYLLLQGYSPQQITVLTLYTGQLLLLKKLMPKKKFEGVRVTAVDNFQGEENEIILLSLVRSNDQDNVGFAAIENRICVSLSRAKHGMFVIGNLQLLRRKSPTWDRIVARASTNNLVGRALRIFCRNHPEKFIDTAKAEDFAAAPEGGCNEQCSYRLQCGHVCQKACHPVDAEHLQVKCKKICRKINCGLEHRCTKTCHFGFKCGPCMINVPKTIPQCGHQQEVPCSLDPGSFQCKWPVTRTLSCGHDAKVACHVDNTSIVDCRETCDAVLECGHPCSGSCSECSQGRLHEKCKKKCDRVLVCGHLCREPCTKECPPCSERCASGCAHSNCGKVCGEPCAPCLEKCQSGCEHGKCTKLCSEMCSKDPCNEPCPLLLACNHPCIGICGEKCPSLCRWCNKEEVEEIFFGFEDEENARFVELVDCHHSFEVQGLDKYMTSQQEETSIQVKSCPKCKTPVRHSLRYGSALKQLATDLEAVKRQVILYRQTAARNNLRDLKAVGFVLLEKFGRIKEHEIADLIARKIERVDRTSVDTSEMTAEIETISETQIECLRQIEKLKWFQKHEDAIAHKFLVELMKHLLVNNASLQQLMDADLELKRLLLYQAAATTKRQLTSSDELDESWSELRSGKRIGKDKIKEMHRKIDALRKRYSMGKLSVEEKTMVIKAMGLRAGHWYKCPNGHVYAIGDCGGAMERSQCPECKSVIGGANHALASGNRHAGEFDGSRYAAWSEAANLANYDPNDLPF